MSAQFLDNMDLERSAASPSRQQAVRLKYRAKDGRTTSQPDRHPGPRRLQLRGVPFARRLRRGAAGGRREPGVEAQTLANAHLAVDANLEIIPVINKVDLPSAGPSEPRSRSRASSASTPRSPCSASAKTGLGIEEMLEAVVTACRRPRATPMAPLRPV
jgi:GTP-binding protein LepA